MPLPDALSPSATPPSGLAIVRTRLSAAIAELGADARRMPDRDVARAMAAIERVAIEHGMKPLAAVARAGMHAAKGPGHRTALACHLERMEDAAACRPLDAAGTTAIMAAIAVRLA